MSRYFTILYLLSFALAASLAASAQATNAKTDTMSKSSAGTTAADTTFVKKAARGGLAEVELGQLAEQKGATEDVKNFGQRMVTDHTKANDQLKELAEKEHIELPKGLDAKDRATKEHLEKLSGEQFDHAYMSDMVKDHRADVAEFERESKSAKDPAVKEFAEQTLPTLREHLKAAEKIAPTQTAQNSSSRAN
jgi:putative membrane protein